MAKEEIKEEGQQMEYADLVKYAQQLAQKCDYYQKQVQLLNNRINEISNFSVFKRLDYLFEVVKNASAFDIDQDFVVSCKREIIDIMTIKEEKKVDEEK